MSTLIGMMIGSRRTTIRLVCDSLRTIFHNIGDPDVCVAVAIAPYIDGKLITLVESFAKLHPGQVVIFPDYEGSYARFANVVIDMSQDFQWTIFSHDDIRLLSHNLVPSVEKALEGKKDPIGWISFIDQDYLTPTSWAPSVREGFHIDAMKEKAWDRKKIHKFHTCPEGWWNPQNTRKFLRSLPYDIPDKPVRVHGPFSHFIMIRSDTLRNVIKKCEDWSPVSLLIDEDWGLTALKNGLYNIWIPSLKYIHVRFAGGTRANGLIQQYGNFVHRNFAFKWKFPHKAIYSDPELKAIQARYRNTNILWSANKRSYEWDWVK